MLLGACAVAVLGLAGPARAATPSTVSDLPDGSPTFDGPVYAVAYAGSTVYVGGDFTTATSGGRGYTRTRLAAVDARTGALLNWAPTADGTVLALATDGGSVYAGGDFGYVSGQHRDGLARLDGSTGAVGSFRHTLSGEPRALAVGHGRLYVGGRLTAVDGNAVANVAAFATASGAYDPGWRAGTDDVVQGITADTNRVYLAGKFRAKLAAVDPVTGTVRTDFAPQLTFAVFGIALGQGTIYAATDGQGGHAMAFDQAGHLIWQATTDGDVATVGYLAGVVYFGGHFDHACGSPRTGDHGVCLDGSVSRVKLAAVDAGTGALLPWNPQGSGVVGVRAIATNPGLGKVAAGGEFTSMRGAWHPRFAQFG
jgi:hypothetical protein